jgi:long-chain fatty acid transport protein
MSSARILFGGTLVLALGLTASEALAEGISVARFGGEHGHPTTDNATAIYYNPAGIAESTGTHVYVDITAAWRQLSYTHFAAPSDVPEPADAQGANDGRATLFNIVPSPMIGVTHSFGDFALGLGFYTPFGGQASWSTNDNFANSKYPGPVDGVQRWGLINGEIRSSYYTLAAAYHVPHTGLSFGVSGNLIQSIINSVRARNATGDDDVTTEGRAWLDATGWEGSFGIGALYEAIPHRLWFGASYQARPNISGGMKLSGTLHNNLGGTPVPSAADVHQDLPDVIQLGARFRPVSDIELRLFGDYTRWSAFKNQCISNKGTPCDIEADGSAAPGETGILLNIPHNWHDTFGIRGGASIWLNPKFEFFSGLGYASSAVPNSTLDPTLPDWDSISFALGAGYQIIKHLHGELSYTQFFFPERDNVGESTLAGLKFPSTSPDSGGYYKQNLGVLDLNLDFAF